MFGASFDRGGEESLFASYGSYDQDGRHAHIKLKPYKDPIRKESYRFLTAKLLKQGYRYHKLRKAFS